MSVENLVLSHVCLSEYGSEELNEVNLTLFSGDILGLISLDNQGMRPFIDLILNNRQLDHGQMFFRGKEVSSYLGCSRKSNKVALIEAKSHLIPSLNIADNFFFAKEKGPLFVNRRKQNRQIKMIFEKHGINLVGNEYPESLSLVDRCRVELIKARITGVKVILLRDPSSFLGPKEATCIQSLVKTIAQEDGVSFIYLCNHYHEIMIACSRLSVMYSGTVILQKNVCDVTEEMMSIIGRDFLKSMTALHRQTVDDSKKQVVAIDCGQNSTIKVNKGECVVLLDLDNKAVAEITNALFNPKSSSYSISIANMPAHMNPRLWSYIPANPVTGSLFFSLSYIDNLTLKKNSYQMPLFWLHRRYRDSAESEFREKNGDVVTAGDLRHLKRRDLYQLIYHRVLFEKPEVVFIVQPFNRMDMYQRIRVLEYISELQKQGIAIVILAISLADSLQLASRLILLQNHKIEKILFPSDFDKATEYGLYL